MKRIAVTGATGFVGGPLIEDLARRGWAVRAGSRRDTGRAGDTFVHGDLAGDVDWARFVDSCDAVVHLAGLAHTSGIAEHRYDRINHLQSARLAAAAKHAGVSRFVFVSSVKAQHGASASRILGEADEPAPDDAYGRSKLAAERAIVATGVSYAIVRPVVIYGPGVKGNLATLRRLAALPIPLPLGAMRSRRSLCALAGLIDAIDLVATADAAVGKVFLVADREPIDLRTLVATMRRIAGRQPWLLPVPPAVLRAGLRAIGRQAVWERLGGDLVVSIDRLASLGWRPRDTVTELSRSFS